MPLIVPTTPVGEIVAEKPARSRVFEHYHIDFCCGGKLSLEEACRRRHLDLRVVQEALLRSDSTAEATTVDPAAMPYDRLIVHIQDTHHAYLKRELPRLERLIRKVATVHGDSHPWMREIQEVYRAFATDLLLHIEKEETALFPAIRALSADTQRLRHPIRALEEEHDHVGAALARMRVLSHDYRPPDDACNTFRAALDGLRELEMDMHQHVHKENNILFPRILQLCQSY